MCSRQDLTFQISNTYMARLPAATFCCLFATVFQLKWTAKRLVHECGMPLTSKFRFPLAASD